MRISKRTVGSRLWAVGSDGCVFRCLLPTACCPLFFAFCLLLLSVSAFAQTKRVVILKADGLQPDIVDRFVHERDPRTGKSLLPWIERVFYKEGSRLDNFYVRGMSLSAPSWSMLDTGQHLQIKGNVVYDRLTLHP